MLIDYFNNLPSWLVWLDWCFYAYKFPLFISMSFGLIGWLIFCYIKQGPAVG